MIERNTIFSQDRIYRYTLWREFEREILPILVHPERQDKFVQFIGLNPSTADETLDDPTIRRCCGFAKAWGYGAICMTNLFAFRATQPKDMKAYNVPIGHENQDWILRIGKEAGLIIAAWGKDGCFKNQDANIKQLLRINKLPHFHLGLNGDGSPKHPLYLRSDTQPQQFT